MKLEYMGENEELSPNFPDDICWLLLADTNSSEWSLYKYIQYSDDKEWQPENKVDEQLNSLLDSATRYPPALALTRNEITKKQYEKPPTLNQFSNSISESLKKYLSLQSEDNFILAESKTCEIGYLEQNEWYWLLKITEKDQAKVYWVSDDYFIYCNDIGNFKVSAEQIEKLKY